MCCNTGTSVQVHGLVAVPFTVFLTHSLIMLLQLGKKTSRLRKAQQLIMLCTNHPALFTSILVYLTMSKLNDQPTNG